MVKMTKYVSYLYWVWGNPPHPPPPPQKKPTQIMFSFAHHTFWPANDQNVWSHKKEETTTGSSWKSSADAIAATRGSRCIIPVLLEVGRGRGRDNQRRCFGSVECFEFLSAEYWDNLSGSPRRSPSESFPFSLMWQSEPYLSPVLRWCQSIKNALLLF